MNKLEKKLFRENTLKDELLYLTGRHKGGLKFTEKLIELCHLKNGQFVLDVGCGVGTTACFLAKKYRCKVIGIDLNNKKIEWSKERAKREHIENLVEFKVADAQDLPFKNDFFDVVITEAVNVYLSNKQKAIKEYIRVLKPEGYIGLHEGTWIKTPTKEIVDLFVKTNQELYSAGFKGYDYWRNEFTSEGWTNLLKNAGLKEITATSYKSTSKTDLNGLKSIGLKHITKTIILYIISPTFRKMINTNVPKEIVEYYGHGIFVGKKVIYVPIFFF